MCVCVCVCVCVSHAPPATFVALCCFLLCSPHSCPSLCSFKPPVVHSDVTVALLSKDTNPSHSWKSDQHHITLTLGSIAIFPADTVHYTIPAQAPATLVSFNIKVTTTTPSTPLPFIYPTCCFCCVPFVLNLPCSSSPPTVFCTATHHSPLTVCSGTGRVQLLCRCLNHHHQQQLPNTTNHHGFLQVVSEQPDTNNAGIACLNCMEPITV